MVDNWEDRIPHESEKAYGYFIKYLELGLNRSIPKLEKQEGISQRTLRRYMEKYHWKERAELYDFDMNEKKKLELQQETDMYYEKKRTELKGYEEIYQAVTASIVEGIMDGTIDPLKASRALKTLAEANIDISKLHLRFFGEPSEIQQINTNQDVQVETNEGFDVLNSDFMNHELEIMKQLVNKDR